LEVVVTQITERLEGIATTSVKTGYVSVDNNVQIKLNREILGRYIHSTTSLNIKGNLNVSGESTFNKLVNMTNAELRMVLLILITKMMVLIILEVIITIDKLM